MHLDNLDMIGRCTLTVFDMVGRCTLTTWTWLLGAKGHEQLVHGCYGAKGHEQLVHGPLMYQTCNLMLGALPPDLLGKVYIKHAIRCLGLCPLVYIVRSSSNMQLDAWGSAPRSTL